MFGFARLTFMMCLCERVNDAGYDEVVGLLRSSRPIPMGPDHESDTWELASMPLALIEDSPALLLSFQELCRCASYPCIEHLTQALGGFSIVSPGD